MKGYTAIEGPLTAEVPLASYMLYNEFKPSDVAYFQKFYDLFTDKGIFEKKVAGRADALQGLSHEQHLCFDAVATWAPPSTGVLAALRRFRWEKLLPLLGPIALFMVWDLVVRAGLIKPILLPPPLATPADAARRAWPAGRCSPTSRSRSGARSRRS